MGPETVIERLQKLEEDNRLLHRRLDNVDAGIAEHSGLFRRIFGDEVTAKPAEPSEGRGSRY